MLSEIQHILAKALFADDPFAALQAALERSELSEADRASLAGISPDGLRMAGLLVKKLRFQRITGGDPRLRQLFDEDPERFVRLYRAYAEASASNTVFPDQESRQFRQWLDRQPPMP